MSALIARSLIFGRDGFRRGPLDLRVAPGEIIAVIGPNGGGKTTLLKTLAGLIRPLAGQIEGGATAYMPPPGAVQAGFSARYLAALGRAARQGWASALSPGDLAAADAALKSLGVGELAERPFDQLSSGEQQRVLIARLLVQDAAVCLLDEPLALLDPAQSMAVNAAIRDLAAQGRAVVVSTHDLVFAGCADRIVALGHPISMGGPDEMLRPAALSSLYGTDVRQPSA